MKAYIYKQLTDLWNTREITPEARNMAITMILEAAAKAVRSEQALGSHEMPLAVVELYKDIPANGTREALPGSGTRFEHNYTGMRDDLLKAVTRDSTGQVAKDLEAAEKALESCPLMGRNWVETGRHLVGLDGRPTAAIIKGGDFVLKNPDQAAYILAMIGDFHYMPPKDSGETSPTRITKELPTALEAWKRTDALDSSSFFRDREQSKIRGPEKPKWYQYSSNLQDSFVLQGIAESSINHEQQLATSPILRRIKDFEKGFYKTFEPAIQQGAQAVDTVLRKTIGNEAVDSFNEAEEKIVKALTPTQALSALEILKNKMKQEAR